MTGQLAQSPEVDVRRSRIVAMCERLGGSAERAGATHLSFKAAKRIFAYYTFDHHGDGMIALWCRAPPGEQSRLVAKSAKRFFVPPYLGPRGWIGLRVDLATIDWKEVQSLMQTAHELTARKKVSQRLQAAKARGTRR